MGIIVKGPFSGKPVKVRDNDAGRAVKDEEGRLFFVLPKSDGSGYYGSITRAGNPKEEARALEMEEKEGANRVNVEAQNEARPRKSSGGGMGKVVFLLIVVAVLAAAGWAVTVGPLAGKIPGLGGSAAPAPAPAPAPANP